MNNPLDTILDSADRALDSLHSASEELATLRVTRRSDDGLVTVVVDSAGALVGIELAEDLSRESADRLATTIVGVASDASRDALARRAAILQRMQSSLSDT